MYPMGYNNNIVTMGYLYTVWICTAESVAYGVVCANILVAL